MQKSRSEANFLCRFGNNVSFTFLSIFRCLLLLLSPHGLFPTRTYISSPLLNSLGIHQALFRCQMMPFLLLPLASSQSHYRESPIFHWLRHSSKECWGQENVDLYIHSPIRLHGVLFNESSAGATLPYPHSSFEVFNSLYHGRISTRGGEVSDGLVARGHG
jgi:hypothetical protein